MNAGTLLLIIADIIALLQRDGIIAAAGTFDGTKLDTLGEDAQFAADVEAVLQKHGVVIPGQADKIIKALPLLGLFIR